MKWLCTFSLSVKIVNLIIILPTIDAEAYDLKN
jgi:hypothetical protein